MSLCIIIPNQHWWSVFFVICLLCVVCCNKICNAQCEEEKKLITNGLHMFGKLQKQSVAKRWNEAKIYVQDLGVGLKCGSSCQVQSDRVTMQLKVRFRSLFWAYGEECANVYSRASRSVMLQAKWCFESKANMLTMTMLHQHASYLGC